MDFYGFYTGKIFDAYEFLGAHPDKDGTHSVPLHLPHHALQSLGNLTTGRNGN